MFSLAFQKYIKRHAGLHVARGPAAKGVVRRVL
jgi:hypothetical protein